MNNNDILWQTKLAARIHDPAEKALVLLRDPAGHEGGTSRALTRLLAIGADPLPEHIENDNDGVLASVLFKQGLKRTIYRHVQRADWWAAAADRPQWPMQEITVQTKSGDLKTLKVAEGAQVRWTRNPVLTHPLTGTQLDLGQHGGLSDTEIGDIKARSFEHFSQLLVALGAKDSEEDLRKVLLAFWRFGPELKETADNGQLGALWRLLPADTRVPDHSIWDHLDLTSAFAGAFAADTDGEAALLAMSIGPVQPFIAAARSTSDLWAGSHLLSRLSWEAMRTVCEELGPDAVLFPRLRGVPQVDMWLRDTMALPDTLFEACEWMRGATDSNPLFSAALPNRFVAVVPRSQAKALASKIEGTVRAWLCRLGDDVVQRLLHEAGYNTETTHTPFEQMREQLKGFPEVHWAAVPFSLIAPRDNARQTDLDTVALSSAMAPFFGVEAGQPSGFLASPAWQVLQKQARLSTDPADTSVFFAPNPGVLYPAIYDLAERLLAAAKAVRPFAQTQQTGWRCSLTGETEWLTTDRAQLARSYRQQNDTLWAKIAKKRPAWAKPGEHLGALPAIKRLWPTVFAEEASKALAAGENGEKKDIGRFVVSTHTMALAHQLDQWLKHGGLTAAGTSEALEQCGPVALPRRLMKQHANNPALGDARRLPALLEDAGDKDEHAIAQAEQLVRRTLAQGEKTEVKLEAYYGLILMDGDRMGKMLSGDPTYAISYRESFHPQVHAGFDQHAARNPAIKAYGTQKRALSPNRHLAISGALNDFSLSVVRHVIEEEHLGRVIYAGGDDVLAMLPVADMLPAMQRLRHAYSGTDPDHEGGRDPLGLTLSKGFAILKDRKLMRMMGECATASCGAVIAHHQAPLAAVRRELEAAEKRAKNQGGRDAFSVTVIKRSGGALRLTAKWGEPVKLLIDTRDFLTGDGVSRRAVYNTLEWLTDLPEPEGNASMLESLLAYQLARQAPAERAAHAATLAQRLTHLALEQEQGQGLAWLGNFLSVAEFLARETRSGASA
ncbi:type III-B CRISPR-associated protein Cas10/Cmr2 [Niveibacterium sp. 24ML]|uniref:type III-B CRISPR-associated protein Cas10/Cmr2 n=1 Tax=Niveibacterium sp. 24ML TaxID=2985512 RepID=UPI00226EFBCB|nr:type III-B CRISPR-associated protein Cas10/Cmr2 [Niveibacterium sp. 24ML]MCX9157914.1 type III-B CRISPR-associated protein Cas10/Cmr2 [Niveibacterium sp. 24ML]